MNLVVAKPFNTLLQRFREGDPVTGTENFEPHAYGDLKKRKFIVDEDKKPAKAD